MPISCFVSAEAELPPDDAALPEGEEEFPPDPPELQAAAASIKSDKPAASSGFLVLFRAFKSFIPF